MYLYKRTYIGNHHRKPEEQLKIKFGKPKKPTLWGENKTNGIKQERISQIVEQVGHWRKANAIHKWFIENCAEGEDDCREFCVDNEQLQELLDIVKKVIKGSKLVKAKIQVGTRWSGKGEEAIMEDGKIIKDSSLAEELLPTTEGFFFGGTAYDQYYFQDLKDTKKILETAVKEGGDYYYRASW